MQIFSYFMPNCLQCAQNFSVFPEDLEFLKKLSPKIGEKVYEIPPPTLCPDCRKQRRMAFLNITNLYSRECAATKKIIISNFSKEKENVVYDIAFWWGDGWDRLATGRAYDFSKSFFEQFAELLKVAPLPALHRAPSFDENSDYTNYAGKNKNCYLLFDSDKNRDCIYCHSINSSENVLDSFRLTTCELCYETIDSVNCYDCRFIQNCQNCSDSWFLSNCIGCKNCFGSVNLRNKQYYFCNQPLTKEAYLDKIQALRLHDYLHIEQWKREFDRIKKTFPQKFMEGFQNENVLGNYLTNCKDAYYCFDSRKLWSCAYIDRCFDDAKNCMDCTEVGDMAELLYECTSSGYNANSNLFVANTLGQLFHLIYCYYCPQSSHLFGCIGLKNAKYCILNRQYTKEEYEELVPKIIEQMKKTREWGEFFPVEISPFAYNESLANDFFPMTKEQIEAKNLASFQKWKWKDEITEMPKVTKTIDAKMLPTEISKIPDDVLSWALLCEKSGKPFKIQKLELEFYRKMNLPLPHFHPDVRHRNRMSKRNVQKLFDRKCDKCGVDIKTTFSPDLPEKVLCEKCYFDVVM